MKKNESMTEKLQALADQADGTADRRMLDIALQEGDVEKLCELVRESEHEEIRLSAAKSLMDLYRLRGDPALRLRLSALNGAVLREHTDTLWDGEREIQTQAYPPDVFPPVWEKERLAGHMDEAAILFDADQFEES